MEPFQYVFGFTVVSSIATAALDIEVPGPSFEEAAPVIVPLNSPAVDGAVQG